MLSDRRQRFRKEADATSPQELLAIRIGHAVFLQAEALAKARGLSDEALAQEEEDDGSQFWRDVIALSRRFRRRFRQSPTATIYDFKTREEQR